MAKCIQCKGEFNRTASVDKLRCKTCLKEIEQDVAAENSPWKKELKKVKKKK